MQYKIQVRICHGSGTIAHDSDVTRARQTGGHPADAAAYAEASGGLMS